MHLNCHVPPHGHEFAAQDIFATQDPPQTQRLASGHIEHGVCALFCLPESSGFVQECGHQCGRVRIRSAICLLSLQSVPSVHISNSINNALMDLHMPDTKPSSPRIGNSDLFPGQPNFEGRDPGQTEVYIGSRAANTPR